MQEFFNKLYNIENFTTYLIIAIAVLVVLFFLILFLGKRDKKIEETKKLAKLTKEGFKDESKPEKAEVDIQKEDMDILLPPIPVVKDEIKEETVQETKVEEKPEVKEEVKEPVIVDPVSELDLKLDESKIEDRIPEPTPVEEKVVKEEIKEEVVAPPIDLTSFTVEETKENPAEVKEESTPVLEEIKLPDFNFEDVINSIEEKKSEEKKSDKPIEVFSSVNVPKKEETSEIELPKLKEEVKEEPKEESITPLTFDAISGESYDINK